MRRWGNRGAVLIDRPRRRVIRWGWGKTKAGVRQNYSFLERFADTVPIPKPLAMREIPGCVVTQESLMRGSHVTAADFDFATGCRQAVMALKPVYEQGWIHGDLTVRNILFDHDQIHLLDFDRSGEARPEFDMWTLYYDWQTHAQGPASYATFMRLLLSDLKDTTGLLAAVEPLYQALPALATTGDQLEKIGLQFARRVFNFFQADIRQRNLNVDLDEAKAALRV